MIHRNWNYCKDLIDDERYGEVFDGDRSDGKHQGRSFARDKVKNLAQANRHNVDKIRKDLKAMLPIIPFTEVKRLVEGQTHSPCYVFSFFNVFPFFFYLFTFIFIFLSRSLKIPLEAQRSDNRRAERRRIRGGSRFH